MEKYCPFSTHDAYLYAAEFEQQHKITRQLGLPARPFGSLTTLHLADYTLGQKISRLDEELNNPGRTFWRNFFPSIYSFIHRADIRNLEECVDVRGQISERVRKIYDSLSSEKERTYAVRLRDVLRLMCRDGVIQNNGYKLNMSENDSSKVAEYGFLFKIL